MAESTLYVEPRDGELGWGEMKTTAFKNLPPLHTSPIATPHLVGFAEGNGLVFLRIGNEIFSLDIKSNRVTMLDWLKKVYEGSGITSIVPYINFCPPGICLTCPELLIIFVPVQFVLILLKNNEFMENATSSVSLLPKNVFSLGCHAPHGGASHPS